MKIHTRTSSRIRLAACWLLLTLAVFPTTAVLHAQDRWAEAINKLTAADATTPPAPGGIVFTGSSSITRWNRNLAQDFPGLNTIGRGFGGSTITAGLQYIDRVVIPYEPRLVIFYAGENDIAAGRTPERVAQDFSDYSEALFKALPQTRLVYISMKPSPRRWDLQAKFDQANALIAAQCAKDPRITFLDVKPAMLGDDGTPRVEIFDKDRLHMNAEGYRIWRELVAPLLVP